MDKRNLRRFLTILLIFYIITIIPKLFIFEYKVSNNIFKNALKENYEIYRCYKNDSMLFNNNGTIINIKDVKLEDFENNKDLQYSLLYFKLVSISMNIYVPTTSSTDIINYIKNINYDVFSNVLMLYMYQENQYLRNLNKLDKYSNQTVFTPFKQFNIYKKNCFKVNTEI